MRASVFMAAALLLGGGVAQADYANIGGLRMYYEIRGAGPPLLLLHGGATTIAYSWAKQIPRWSKRHRVIAVEQMGHGHTADLPEREFSYEQMAEDTAALIAKLKVAPVDIVGWSDGGNIGLVLAMRHPELVHKLVVSGPNCRDGRDAEFEKWLESGKPEEWPSDLRDAYVAVSPDGVAHWPLLLARVKKMWLAFDGWDEKELAKIRAPVMLMVGDEDWVRTEYAVELHRAIADSRLFVVPGTEHPTFRQRPEWVNPVIEAFFAEPLPSVRK
ncbi:MAG: Alpha/beta hydrolase fold-1 [bacterium]|nr:Alpha/beta hydrolase fold-1 [bacterium]